MLKTHFDPYAEDDSPPDKTLCGILPPLNDYFSTSNWNHVTCNRCLSMRKKLQLEVDLIEEDIVKQMGDFVKFQNEQDKVTST